MKLLRLAAILLLSGVVTTAVMASGLERVKESYDNGKKKLQFETRDGQKNGRYFEWYENGRFKVKAQYRDGVLHGTYIEYDERGKVSKKVDYVEGKKHGTDTEYDERGRIASRVNYIEGKRHGMFQRYENRKLVEEKLYLDGIVALPKSIEILEKEFAAFDKFEVKVNGQHPKSSDYTAMSDRVAATRQLLKYRHLSGVPTEGFELDAAYNVYSDYGVKVHIKAGKGLNHHPKNPGMPEEDFKLGYKGTSQGNLAMSSAGMTSVHAMNMWMDDSDSSNIARIGHRRWALNPVMLRVGFAAKGGYSVMYCFDKKRKNVPDYNHIAFPAAGYNPNTIFRDHYAWHVTLNRKKYNKPDSKKVKVQIIPYRMTSKGLSAAGKPLKMGYFNVDNSGIGDNRNAIVFRPAQGEFSATDKEVVYKVVVTGLSPKKGAPKEIVYYVAFYESKAFTSTGRTGGWDRGRRRN